MKLNPYLNFNGNCEAAFRYYEKNLGGKITAMMTHADAPVKLDLPEAHRNKILHARIAIAGTEIFASDAPPDRFAPIHSSYLSLQVSSAEEAERVYAALSEGGEIFMPLQETFWAARFAMLRDRFGIPWMVNLERPAQNS